MKRILNSNIQVTWYLRVCLCTEGYKARTPFAPSLTGGLRHKYMTWVTRESLPIRLVNYYNASPAKISYKFKRTFTFPSCCFSVVYIPQKIRMPGTGFFANPISLFAWTCFEWEVKSNWRTLDQWERRSESTKVTHLLRSTFIRSRSLACSVPWSLQTSAVNHPDNFRSNKQTKMFSLHAIYFIRNR